MLRQEKEQLENVLSHKSTEVRKNLQIEAERYVTNALSLSLSSRLRNFLYILTICFAFICAMNRVDDELKKNLG